MVLPQTKDKKPSVSLKRRSRSKKKSFKRLAIAICLLLIIILYTPSRQWLFQSLLENDEASNDDNLPASPLDTITAVPAGDSSANGGVSVNHITPIDEKCEFRVYDPPRHYNLDLNGSLETQPAFLSDAKYVRGMLPIIINPGREGIKKVCMDTSEWEPMDSENNQRWPFSDGQNPSFVSLRDDPYAIGDGGASSNIRPRIDRNTLTGLTEIYGADAVQTMYIGLVLFGDSQCRWNMTPAQLHEQGYSSWQKARSVRTKVAIMDSDRNLIGKAVLELVQDSSWGTKRKKIPRKMRADGVADDSSCTMEGKENDGCFDRSIQQLDDPRFFFHGGSLHVLFRNGPSFGYEAQVQHPVHIKAIGDGKFEAYIKASEMFEVCCGRNIAFISEIPGQPKDEVENPNTTNDELLALTWVDPVTVEVIKTPTTASSSITAASQKSIQRRLRKNKKVKSHIHGTNGYLLPLHSTSELLGVAHFHRPEDRDPNPYARVGHHYTHAFFTIQRKEEGTTVDGDTSPKFVLKRLSNEFIFESPSKSTSDGDIIQFASGLDLVGSDTEGKLLVSYGINDCESASIFLNMDYVQGLLREVKDGDEVINMMAEIKSAL